MLSGWSKLLPSEVMDCVSAGLGRRDLEQIIFCCYHSNPTQGTLWGYDKASLSISSWFTNAGWPATGTCCTMLSISSALGKFIPGLCLLLPKDSTQPGQVQTDVLRAAIKEQRTDKLVITSIVPWQLPEWVGNCSELQITHVFQWLLLNTFCYIQVLQNNCCHQEYLLQCSTFLLIYLECEVGRDVSSAGDETCQDLVNFRKRFYFVLGLVLLLCC